MMDNRRHALVVVRRGFALATLLRIGKRLLEGSFRDGDALHADGETRIVHHGEHAGEALVLLADQPANRTRLTAFRVAVAEDHRAGRRAVDAKLVLDRGAEDVVAVAQRPLLVDEEL